MPGDNEPTDSPFKPASELPKATAEDVPNARLDPGPSGARPILQEDELVRTVKYDKASGADKEVVIVRVAGRLRLLHEDHEGEAGERSNIRFQTDILNFEDGKRAAVKVIVDTKRGRFIGHGTANVNRDANLAQSLLEVAETRGIARALRFAGYGLEYQGAEELEGKSDAPDAPGHPSLDDAVMPEQLESFEALCQELADLTGDDVSIPEPSTVREGVEAIRNLRVSIVELKNNPAQVKRMKEIAEGLDKGP